MLRVIVVKFSFNYQEYLTKGITPVFPWIRYYSIGINQVYKSKGAGLMSLPTNSFFNKTVKNMLPFTQRNSSGSSMSSSEAFRNLDYTQLIEQKNDNKCIVIDVREKHELDSTGVIPGAHHIPLGEIETAFKASPEEFQEKYDFRKPTTDDHIIFSCRSGKRSLVALDKALGQGFQYAKHYTGGWLDWEQKSTKTE